MPTPTNPIPSDAYPRDKSFTMFDGTQTHYVYVPSNYDAIHSTPTKMFLFLHGNGGDSSGDIWTVSPGGTQDWISICPGGRENSGGHSSGWNEDMPGGKIIVMNAIAYMKTRFNIDPGKVFIGGYSGGGDMAYYAAFNHSNTFAGVIAENTNPWRDNPFGNFSAAAFAANASGWKFNVAHLYHTSDSTYPKAETETALNTMVSNGYPVKRLEKAGAHFDANTNPDLVAWFPQWIQSAGWEGPGGRGITDSWVSRPRTGTNVVGLEEPTWTTGYTHPPHGQGLVDFLSSEGVGVVRIMLSWESIQSALLEAIPGTGAALTYFNDLKATIDKFLAKGIYVLICPWGYNPAAGDAGDTDITYRGSAFTPAQFGDFWGKMAIAFSYDQRIAFGLMNEPHTGGGSIVGVTLDNWFLDAQAAIDAIRSAGATNYIVVPGMDYASAASWVSNGSAAKFIALTDTYSPKRLIAECHNYGDQFPTNAGNNLGPNMQAMVTHARANGYKIFVGEVARSANPTTNPSSADDITAWASWVTFCATTNSDVVLGWAWWAVDDNTIAGWGTDFFHWSLVAAGKNNVNTQFMNLIQGSFVT